MRLPPTRLLALGAAAAAAATLAYILHRRRLRSKLAAAPISEWAKVELHVHFDGAFDWDVVYEAARGDEMCHPVEAVLPPDPAPFPIRSRVAACGCLADYTKLCTAAGGERSLRAMLECFLTFTPAVRGKLDVIEELAYRFVARQAAQRVVYTEMRYSPQLLAVGGGDDAPASAAADPRPVLAAVTRGLRRGEAAHPGTRVNQLLCMICWHPEWSQARKFSAQFLKAILGAIRGAIL